MNRLLVPLAAVLLAAITGCSNTNTTAARPTGGGAGGGENPGRVVASIGDEKITLGDLDGEIKDELAGLERQYRSQKIELRENSLEGLIAKKLMAAEAARQGVSEEEVMQGVMEGKVEPVSEEELRAFYDQQSAQAAQSGMPGGLPPYEQIKDRMEQYLNQQRQQKLIVDYLNKLKADAKVVVSLFDVEAIGPSRGPKDAPVTIVEFSDFECPYCSRALETLEKVEEAYQGKVRVVFRDYPLQFHANAKKAAEAGHCANEQGKFWELHDLMFANQRALGVEELKGYAQEAGLEQTKFDACLDNGEMADVVAKNMVAGEEAGVSGTPAFFINGTKLSGAVPFEEFQKVIDSELVRLGHEPLGETAGN